MTRALALICCAASFLVSPAASAKPSRVALTQIEGDTSGDVHDAVAEALEGKELSLIASREVNRAVDKLGDLSDLTEKDFKKLATELDADAIVAGKLDKVGSAKTLKFRLFVHKKMAKGFTVSFKDAKSEKFRTLLHDKILDKIGVTGAGPGGDDDEDARPAKKKKAADDEEDPLAKKDKKARKGKDAKADADDDDARPAKKTRAAKADDDDARPAKKTADADDDARPAKKKTDADDDARTAGGDDDAKPAKKKADADDDDAAPRKAKKRVAAADDGAEVEATAAPIAESARGANRAGIRLDIGGSVLQHSFKFNTVQLPQRPRDTVLSPVPGARLDGEVYPLALTGSQGAAAGLGLGFEYDRTLSLHLNPTDNTPGANPMTAKVGVKQGHYTIGLRYRLVFGKTETSPTLTLGAGYGKQLFSVNLADAGNSDALRNTLKQNTPETEYTIFDPGAMFRVPVTRMVAFALGGRAMIITSAGPIQTVSSYGRARVYGAEGVIALDVVLGQHLGLRFSGEFSQIGYTFLGTGALTDVDGNKMQDVGGLADRMIGGAATLTLLY
ncbi:MAG TPA: hypothetical protein VF516_33460 [Kofleriaceae bacterium]